jgi:electron transport complex protein RnfE
MKSIFVKGLWSNHPTFRQVLGMCPTLAVTTSVINGFAMGMSVVFVLVFSGLAVSLIKKQVPSQVRIAIYTIIIATFVTLIDIYLKASFPAISAALGPFIPLIIVNCIILGRVEAFASKNAAAPSIVDALGMGLGFTWGLMLLGAVRELLGAGTVLGFPILGDWFEKWIVMILPAGAFLALGFLVALMNVIEKRIGKTHG